MSISSKVAKKLKAVYQSQKDKRQEARYRKILIQAANTPGGIPWYESPAWKKQLSPLSRGKALASTAKQKGKQVLSSLNTRKKAILSTLPGRPKKRVMGRAVKIVEWDAKRAPPLQRQRVIPKPSPMSKPIISPKR